MAASVLRLDDEVWVKRLGQWRGRVVGFDGPEVIVQLNGWTNPSRFPWEKVSRVS